MQQLKVCLGNAAMSVQQFFLIVHVQHVADCMVAFSLIQVFAGLGVEKACRMLCEGHECSDALTDVCAYADAAAACAYMCWVEFCSVREFLRQKQLQRRHEGRRQQGRRTRPANQAFQVMSQTIACSCQASCPKPSGCCLLQMH